MTRRLLKQSKIPVVETFELSNDPVDVNIGLSHSEAGRAATQYLLDLGHRRVGFVMGNMDIRAASRLEGYKFAMGKAGLEHERLVFSMPQPSTIALGSAILATMAERNALPEALFCIDDNLAMGAVMKCREIGIKVPEALSIIGFHDLEFAAYASPPLTTVATPRYEIGKMAAEVVLIKIKHSRAVMSKRVDVGYRILKRGSTTNVGS